MGSALRPDNPATGVDLASKPVVLHVVSSLEHGGTERFLCRLLNRLAGDGMRHVLCTLRAAGERVGQLDRRIEVQPLNLTSRSPAGFLRLASLIRHERAAIVHARNPGTWTDALLAARLGCGVRLVLGFHGLQSGGDFARSLRLRLRALGAHRHTFATVSHAGRKLLIDRLGCPPQGVHVLANGVDTYHFALPTPEQRQAARAHWGIGAEELAVGMVGNLFSPVKGHRVLVDAVARLAPQHRRLRVLIAGFGPLEESITERIHSLGLQDRVRLLGGVEDPASLLAALDVYVCPSLSEGMSNALLEAMACGRPCVATDVADHRRMFSRVRATDLLVPPDDDAALAQAIGRLLADDGRRVQLGAALRRSIETDHPFEQAVAGYARFYRALLPEAPQCPDADDPVEASRCLS